MRIVAYQTLINDGTVLLRESTGEYVHSNDIGELFTFLLEPYEDTIKVCWDLDQTVSAFLRLLGKSACMALLRHKRWGEGGFKVFYIPSKVFSVSYGANRANLYGLEQYYPEMGEPDVNKVQLLGVKLLEELKKMGFTPAKLTSPVAIYEESVLSKMDLPLVRDMPMKVAEFAWRCSGRLWIEVHQIGCFKAVSDYDLQSAFPNIAKDLVDIRDCEWVEDKAYIMGAIYGYVHCNVTIYDWVKASPIIQDTEKALISPTGTWEGYLTKDELDFITKWGIGEFEVIDGWWAVTTRKALKKPLKVPMERLLSYKQGNEIQRLLAKRMSTGIYGKMGEERADEFGPYFNPCWFAEIPTRARLQVGEFLYSHGIGPEDNEGYRKLIAIGVDGVLLANEVDITENQWKLAYQGPALVISSGLVYTNLTKPKGLKLPDVLRMIKEHPRRPYYETKVRRRLTLGDALAQDRLEDIGKEMDFGVSLSLINPVHDREFKKLPQTGEQLLKRRYQSEPIRL